MSKSQYTTRLVTLGHAKQIEIHRHVVNLSTPRYTQTVHWHDFFELELILSGQAIHLLNGKPYPVRAGNLYLLTPADLHTLLPDPAADDPCIEVFNIAFSDTIVSETSFVEVQTLPPPLTAEALGDDFTELVQLSERLYSDRKSTAPHNEDIRRHLFLAFIFHFLQLYHIQHTTDLTKVPETRADRELTYIRNAIAYIRYNFRDPDISVAQIAKAVCLSPNYFGTIFKKHIGETCLSYIKKMRMSFAVVLLQNSGLTVAEISERCGYANVPYFISDFREIHGISPKKHRDLYQKKN